MKSSMIDSPLSWFSPANPSLWGGVALLLAACLPHTFLGPESRARAEQRSVSTEDISAAFGKRSNAETSVKDWRGEVEDISETKPEQQFRFTLPYGRDPFALPGALFTNSPASATVPSGGDKRFVSSAYQLKGTWRQLGGIWQAILQDVSGEPIVVTTGDKVGEAEVLAITDSELTLRWLDIALDGKAQFRRLTLSL